MSYMKIKKISVRFYSLNNILLTTTAIFNIVNIKRKSTQYVNLHLYGGRYRYTLNSSLIVKLTNVK